MSLASFSRRAAESRLQKHGVPVIFRGETMRVLLSQGQPDMSLESGGFRHGATWRLRFPATLQPAPGFLGSEEGTAKEEITEVGTGRKFYVTGCIPAPADSEVAHEHIVEARLP